MQSLNGWLWPVLAAPAAGSLSCVLIRRLPQGRPVALARSACEACGKALAPWHMIPLISFIAQRGRCANCGAPIAPEHLAVELASILVPASAAACGLQGSALWLASLYGWVLLTLSWIDARHLMLPDALTLPLLLAGLATTWWLDPGAIPDHVLAAALAYTALRAIEVSYRYFRGRDGLGAGDAKLLAAIGAWTGLAGLSPALLVGALAGLMVALPRALRQRTGGGTMIPFGPCLALGGWVAVLAQNIAY